MRLASSLRRCCLLPRCPADDVACAISLHRTVVIISFYVFHPKSSCFSPWGQWFGGRYAEMGCRHFQPAHGGFHLALSSLHTDIRPCSIGCIYWRCAFQSLDGGLSPAYKACTKLCHKVPQNQQNPKCCQRILFRFLRVRSIYYVCIFFAFLPQIKHPPPWKTVCVWPSLPWAAVFDLSCAAVSRILPLNAKWFLMKA